MKRTSKKIVVPEKDKEKVFQINYKDFLNVYRVKNVRNCFLVEDISKYQTVITIFFKKKSEIFDPDPVFQHDSVICFCCEK